MGVKILIADEQCIFCEGLKCLLTNSKYRVIGECSNKKEIIDKINKYKPDIIITEYNIGKYTVIDILNSMKKENIFISIIVLTSYNKKEMILNIFEKGVMGCVLKTSSYKILNDAIINVQKGKKYIDKSIIKSDLETVSMLTKREKELLRYLAEGLLNKEIAEKMGISPQTVKNHMSSIFKKLNVSDRTQAAVFAINNII